MLLKSMCPQPVRVINWCRWETITRRGGYKAQLDRTVEPIVMMSLHHHMKPCSNGT